MAIRLQKASEADQKMIDAWVEMGEEDKNLDEISHLAVLDTGHLEDLAEVDVVKKVVDVVNLYPDLVAVHLKYYSAFVYLEAKDYETLMVEVKYLMTDPKRTRS